MEPVWAASNREGQTAAAHVGAGSWCYSGLHGFLGNNGGFD